MSTVRTGLLLSASLAALGGAAQAQTLAPINFTYEGGYVHTISDPTPQYTHDSTNNSYATGNLTNGNEYRSFFSFDLSALNLAGKQVTSATFSVTRFGYLTDQSNPRPSQALSLFAVDTSAATLHVGGSSAVDGAVFTDLGDGSQYASYAFSQTGSTTDVLNITLNSLALADIQRKAGGFFSLGGIIQTGGTDFGEAVFVSSNSPNVARLTVTLAAAPEPTTWVSLALGGLGLGMLALRARRAF